MPSYRKSRYTGAAGTTPTVMQSVRRVEFLIPKGKTGAVMGQGGENIRRITEKSGANITYDRKAATPTHAIFVLQGKWNDVIRASELISESAGVQGTMKGVDPGLSRGGGGAGMRGYDDSRDMVAGREAGAYGRNAPRSALSGPSAAQPSQSYGDVADRVYSDYMTRLHNNGANPYRGGPSADDDNRLLNVAARGNLGGPGGRSSDHLRKDIQQLENLLDRYDSGPSRMDRGGQYSQGMGGRDTAPYAAGRDAGFAPEGREGMKRRMDDWGRPEVPDKRQRMGAEPTAAWGSGSGAMGRMDARAEEQRRMEERRRMEDQRRMEEQRRVEEMRQREEQRRLEEQRRIQQQQQQPSFEEERRRREEQRRMQELREERQRMEQRSRMEMELMEQRRKLEEQRRQEQQRLIDQQRMFEQQRQEEERLLAIERRRLEEQKMLEEQRLAEERRRTEMAQVQLMEERRMVEQQYANLARMQESIQMQPPMMDRDMMPRGDPMRMGAGGDFMPMNRPPMDRPPMEGPFGLNMMGPNMGPRMDRGMRPPGPPGMRGGMQPPLGRGRRPGLPPRMGPLAKRLSPSQLSLLAEKVQRFKYGLMRFPKRGTVIQAMKNILIRSKCKLPLNFAINQIKRGSKTELEGILTLGDIILAQAVGSKEKAVRIAAYRDAMRRMKMLSPRDIVMAPNPPVKHLSLREEDEILATRPNVLNKKEQDEKNKASSEATPDKKAAEESKGEEGNPAKIEEGTPTKDKDATDGKEGSSKPMEQSPDKSSSAPAAKAGQAATTPAKPEAKSAPQGKTAPPAAKPAPAKQAPSSAPAKTPVKTPASTPAKTAATTPAKMPAKPKRAEHACDELLGVGDKLEQFRQELLSPASGAEADVMKAFNKLAQEHEISMAFIFLRDTPEGEKPQNLACELYLEDLFVASAQGADKKSSKTAVYEAALAKLKPDDAISLLVVEGRRLKYDDIRRTSLIDYVYMNHSPEVEGLDTETNTSQLKRMGLYPVKEDLSASSFVFVESDNPKQPVNLKTMAAINGMNFKLEVTTNMARPAGKRHKCDVFIQDKLIATAFMSSKKMAKQIGCENALKALNTSKHNVIKYLPLQDMKSLQTEATIMTIATKLWKTKGDGKGDATLTPQTAGYDKWVEAAVLQIMENYIKQVTLDLLPFAPELPAAVHNIISRVAQHHGFVYVQSPGSKYHYVQKNRQRRSAREICHLLQMIPGGRSGRYKLMREASSLSQQQRDKVKELYFANKEIFV